ncbi:MAG: hypothetical protein U9N38_04875 [Thermodesulfobacteriota bacterium]|nr:hypothetical protein [Thermodesulfobacteriota bacterium]
MKKISIAVCVVVCMTIVFSGCSVYMAAKKDGINIEEASQCKTQACLIAKGAILISSRESKDGTLIDVFNIKKPTGSTSRAVMHGILDVATLGLWELAGTPIEGSKSKPAMIPIEVHYDKNEIIKSVKILQ